MEIPLAYFTIFLSLAKLTTLAYLATVSVGNSQIAGNCSSKWKWQLIMNMFRHMNCFRNSWGESHTYTQATHRHTHRYTHTRTRIFALKLTKQSWAESNLAACLLAHTAHTLSHTHTHSNTRTLIYTYFHIHIHIYIYTHTHTHMNLCKQAALETC